MERKTPIWARLFGLCLLLAGVSAVPGCTPEALPPASAEPQPSAYIAMDTQYYDVVGNIVEIPVLLGDENEDTQVINQALFDLRDSFAECWEAPYKQINRQLMAYPTEAGRYLNLTLRENTSSYGNDGGVYTWVYDKTEHRQVTAAEALEAAGVTQDELRDELEALLSQDEHPRTLESMEIAGFRMCADGGAELYLYAYLPDEMLPDNRGEVDGWRRLYMRSEKGLTRYNGEYIASSPQFFSPLLPPEETLALSPALWCRWGPGGGEPEGGFIQPDIPDWVTVQFRNATDAYVLYRGELVHYASLDDYSNARLQAETAGERDQFIPLFSGFYDQSLTQGVYTSAAWPAVDALSRDILDLMLDDNEETAAGLSQEYLQSGVLPKDWEDAGEFYYLNVSYAGSRVICLYHTITLSSGVSGGDHLTAAQVYDRETGTQLTFSDLFSDPEEAARRVAEHLSGVTGLSTERTAQLLSPYGFFLAPNGQVAVFCPGWELGDAVVLDFTEFLPGEGGNGCSYHTWWNAQQALPTWADARAQALISRFDAKGAYLVHYAVPFILPQDLLSDLFLYS